MTIGASTTNPWKKKYNILVGLNGFIPVFDTKIHPFQKSASGKKTAFYRKNTAKTACNQKMPFNIFTNYFEQKLFTRLKFP